VYYRLKVRFLKLPMLPHQPNRALRKLKFWVFARNTNGKYVVLPLEQTQGPDNDDDEY
jgi:hypothetical protein